jgi:hypothetical protein
MLWLITAVAEVNNIYMNNTYKGSVLFVLVLLGLFAPTAATLGGGRLAGGRRAPAEEEEEKVVG